MIRVNVCRPGEGGCNFCRARLASIELAGAYEEWMGLKVRLCAACAKALRDVLNFKPKKR